ncbi:venom serine protease-like isoform X2 [Plodia interpunctella]|nr:venom serine protease-like isoform X2 [Plodia interpunctella]XP_053618614.1 venom serine protease-like isoform X2 [Plodia interpunctella]
MKKLQLSVYVIVVVVGFASTQDPDCDYSQLLEVGYTYDVANKEYPNSYVPGVQCRWILQCPPGYNCQLDCSDINLPQTASCSMDRLLISKSGDPQLSAADYYCGRGTVSAVSTGQVLTVGLITSYDSPGGAFYCSASAQPAASPSCSCGYKKMTRIVGGNETAVNEFPSMAGIVLDVATAKISCGGVIISQRYVLTAAHCLKKRHPGDMAVVVGEHDVTTGDSPATRAYKVEDYLIHPGFDVNSSTDNDYDIAIIRVSEDIAFGPMVGPICLPFNYTNTDMTGRKLTALGWGFTQVGGVSSKVLRKVDLDVISQSQCQQAVSQLTPRQFCTYTPGKDTCQYDSGGPLLYTDPPTGTLFNIGIVSYGDYCGMDDSPAVNTKVTSYLTWILSNTQDADYCRK